MHHFIKQWIVQSKILELMKMRTSPVSWKGDYPHWNSVSKLSTGYDDFKILDKVLASTLQVITGKAAFERDSVAFTVAEYNWPLVAMLLWIALKENNKLNILDFGGSLGSQYFQHKTMLANIKKLSWNIVEQPHFVEIGRSHIHDPWLHFFNSVEDSVKNVRPQVILLSSVLPYLEKPHEFIDNIIQEKFPYILIEKTPFFEIDKGKDRLTLQTVKKPIYDATYPAWFFSKQKFLLHFDTSYELLFTFSHDGQSMAGTTYQGMLFKLR